MLTQFLNICECGIATFLFKFVQKLLQNAVTMTVEAPSRVSKGNNFIVGVRIKNDKTGHDIPSGNIFDRQMWIEIILKDVFTNTVYFNSGILDDNGDLLNHHSAFVSDGLSSEDTSLTLFNGIAYDDHGEETIFFWEANSFKKTTIPAFKSHFSTYYLNAPDEDGEAILSVRLRFRSFPPYLLRAVGQQDLVSELIIFDMSTFNQTIVIN